MFTVAKETFSWFCPSKTKSSATDVDDLICSINCSESDFSTFISFCLIERLPTGFKKGTPFPSPVDEG